MSGVTKPIIAAAVTTALLALTLLASVYDARRPPFHLSAPLKTFPSALPHWRSDSALTMDARTQELLAATDAVDQIYRQGQSEVDLLIAFYATQSPGVGPHAVRNCLSASWSITTTAPAQLVSEDGPVSINRLLIRRPEAERLLLYWYQTPNRIVRNEYARKFFVAWDALFSGHKAGAIVRLIVANDPREEQTALTFGADVARELHHRLGGVVHVAQRSDEPSIQF